MPRKKKQTANLEPSVSVLPEPEIISPLGPEPELPPEDVTSKPASGVMRWPKAAMASLALAVLAGSGSAAIYFSENSVSSQNQAAETVDPAEQARREALAVVEQAGRIIALPEGEEPSIATVAELEPLAGQTFFANAEIGDKALVYIKSGRAYLYRPSQNKIIEVGSFEGGQNVLGANTENSQAITVEIRNGTGKSGQAAAAQTKLAALNNLEVSKLGNAAQAYAATQIVVLNSAAASFVAQIQNLIAGQAVTGLPQAEPASSADIVIILGKE